MKKTRIALLLIIAMSFSAVPLGLFGLVSAEATVSYPDYQAVDWQSGLAGDINMPDITDESFKSSIAQPRSAAPYVGQVVYDWYLSAIQEDPYMTCRAIVGNVEVWVANNVSFPYKDPRNDDIFNLNITDAMCEYVAQQFNDIIYPADTTYFGMPVDRDGTGTIFESLGWPSWTYDWINAEDNPQRTIIKVLNIQDTGYTDPTYPYFVIGFFSRTYDGYYNRNMIHIDAWQWWRRVGELGHSWYPEYPDKVVEEGHAHDYESTIAHEYQHLIHADWNPSDDLFMNEGCSMYAEQLTYGIATDYFESYLATPDNSLTIWGDQGDINILADYGVAALWTVYLSDHYGGADIIRDFVQAGIPGIEGINAALYDRGYTWANFDTVYHDWRIANLIHSDYPGCGRYNYKSIDLGALETQARVHWADKKDNQGTDFGNTITILGYDTGISMLGTYGTDYIGFDYLKGLNFLTFSGDSESTLPHWEMVDGVWYSGEGDLMNTLIAADVFVDPSNPTLELYTYWDIEDYWDFGFVQVSTDGGLTWTSLANDYTTMDHDPSAHPDIVANLPGLTSWSGFITPDGWIDMTFDLSAYAGETGANVLIGFRYMTDWSFTYEGWFIAGATVSGNDIMGSLQLQDQLPEVNWMVTIVEQHNFVYKHKHKTFTYTTYSVHDMWVSDYYDKGIGLTWVDKNDNVFLVITPMMNLGLADYHFDTFRFKCGFGR